MARFLRNRSRPGCHGFGSAAPRHDSTPLCRTWTSQGRIVTSLSCGRQALLTQSCAAATATGVEPDGCLALCRLSRFWPGSPEPALQGMSSVTRREARCISQCSRMLLLDHVSGFHATRHSTTLALMPLRHSSLPRREFTNFNASVPKRDMNFLQPVCGTSVTSTVAEPMTSLVPAGRFSLERSRST